MSEAVVAGVVPAESERTRMSRLSKLMFAFAALVVLLFACALVGMFTVLSGRIADQESALAERDEAIAGLKVDLGVSDARIVSLRGDVDRTAEALRASGAQQVADLEKKLKATGARVTQIGNCIPELQSELNGLSVSTSDQNGWLTGAYITNPVQVSRVCHKTLFGSS